MGHLSNTQLKKDAAPLLGLLLVGLILRLYQINGALWYDEAFSAHLADLPLLKLLLATTYDVHPPAYYLLLWAVTRSLGHTEFVLRLPSLLAGLALIPLVYGLGRGSGFRDKTVWLAVGLATVSPFQIYYSNEARFYALQSAALTAAAIGVFFQRRGWLVGGAVLALYLHHMSVLFGGSLFIGGLIYHRNWTKQYLTAWALVGLGWLPMAGLTIYQATAIHNNYWIPALSSPGRLISILDDLIFFIPENPYVLASALATALGLLAIGLSLKHIFIQPDYPPMMLLAVVVVSLSAVTLFSLVWQPVLINRVMAPLAPLYYLLLAWCVTVSHRWVTAWAAVTVPALLVIIAALMQGQLGHKPLDENYLYIYGEFEAGDGVFHPSIGSFMTWHYYRPDVPQYVLDQPGQLEQTLSTDTMQAMGIPLANFDEVACQRRRWWLIQYDNPTSTPLELAYVDELTRRYPSTKNSLLRDDVTVEAAVYLITPHCATVTLPGAVTP